MNNFQFDIKDVPQELIDIIKKQFDAEPKIRDMRIKQDLCARQGRFGEAFAIGGQINDLFARVVRTYLDDTENEYQIIDFKVADLPENDRSELMEIVITLFLAADIIDTAAREFNNILHRTDDTMDMVQFNDISKLAKEAKGKIEWFSSHTSYMKDLSFGDRSDNMYTMLRNKARSFLRKTKQ